MYSFGMNKYKLKEQLPEIGKTYTIAMIIGLIILVMMSSFLSGGVLSAGYVLLIVLLVLTYGQNNGFRYQKIHKKLRPFVVGRYLQAIATVAFVGALIASIMQVVVDSSQLVPYLVFIALCAGMTWQYYQIYRIAHRKKTEHPEVCEFC